jgi:hypothetical protein
MTRHGALELIASTLAATGADLGTRWREAAPHWSLLLEAATAHRVATPLHTALGALGIAPALPAPLTETLAVLADLSRERNETIVRQAAHATRALNDAGIAPIVLKGAGNLLSGLYSAPGDRLIGDIDLLVRPEELGAAVAALTNAGYAVQSPDLLHDDGGSRVDVHYPPLEHRDWPMLVELHWALLPPPLGARLPVHELFARATPLAQGAAVLAMEDALLYNVLHAEARHHLALAQGARLWQLYDSLLLARRLDPGAAGRAAAALQAPACVRYFQHHAGALHVLFGAPLFPGAPARPLGTIARLRLRHQLNQSFLGRADTAVTAALSAIIMETRGLRAQWRDPARRAALLVKLRDPKRLLRRLRNLIARLGGKKGAP